MMTREERAMIRKAAEQMAAEPDTTPVGLMGRGWVSLLNEADEADKQHEEDKHRLRLMESHRARDHEERERIEAMLAAVLKAARYYLDGWNPKVSDEDQAQRERELREVLDGDPKQIAEIHDWWIAKQAVNAENHRRLDEALAGAKERSDKIDKLIADVDAKRAEQRAKKLPEAEIRELLATERSFDLSPVNVRMLLDLLDAERNRVDMLARLIQRQRRVRAELSEEQWTEELAEIEGAITDMMMRVS